MASRQSRGGGGDRVLEGRHVIGLFMLMLVFSGVFFALGYVMGRNQYDGQVRAATNPPRVTPDPVVAPKSDLTSKRAKNSASSSSATTSASGWGSSSSSPSNSTSGATSALDAPSDEAPPSSDWGFYNAGKGAPDDRLKPAPANSPSTVSPSQVPAVANNKNAAHATNVSARAQNGSTVPGIVPIPAGAYVLQVAALHKEADAKSVASSLLAKKFPAFVVNPTTDKYYHVQVGPYHDLKSANAAKKGLESAGFKAIVKH